VRTGSLCIMAVGSASATRSTPAWWSWPTGAMTRPSAWSGCWTPTPAWASCVMRTPAMRRRSRSRASAGSGCRCCEAADAAAGTLDGGDVIVCGDRVAIGISARTNREGAEQLCRIAEKRGHRAFLCPVDDRLHLASAVTVLGPDRLVGTAAGFRSLDAVGAAEGVERLLLDDDDLPAANVLAVAGRCFIAAGYPRAAALLRAAGEDVVEVELDEFTKADGGPTCLVAVID